MRPPVVMDSNVAFVGNGAAEQASAECVLACTDFPDDEMLAGFDRDDRKFVAVAIASGESPPILNASDTDWHDHRQALSRHGVAVEFVCPELMNAPVQ